jgi:hypothetical protein
LVGEFGPSGDGLETSAFWPTRAEVIAKMKLPLVHVKLATFPFPAKARPSVNFGFVKLPHLGHFLQCGSFRKNSRRRPFPHGKELMAINRQKECEISNGRIFEKCIVNTFAVKGNVANLAYASGIF